MATEHQLRDGGTVEYIERFLDPAEADRLFTNLRDQTDWQRLKAVFGHQAPRLTAYYADPGIDYSYSGITHRALPWTEELCVIRDRVVELAKAPFNSLLLNYYRDGNDSMGWHADDELELGTNPLVPSISLGAVRRFVLRHNRSKEKQSFELAHGSLLLMGGTLQAHWKHALPKTKAQVGGRINLTFRNIIGRQAC